MNQYMDVKALSTYLNIKSSTLYAWAAQGKIPCLRIHGLLRFRPDEIDQWLKSFEKPTLPNPAKYKTPSQSTEIDTLIASAKREVYTARRGETRPNQALSERRK